MYALVIALGILVLYLVFCCGFCKQDSMVVNFIRSLYTSNRLGNDNPETKYMKTDTFKAFVNDVHSENQLLAYRTQERTLDEMDKLFENLNGE